MRHALLLSWYLERCRQVLSYVKAALASSELFNRFCSTAVASQIAVMEKRSDRKIIASSGLSKRGIQQLHQGNDICSELLTLWRCRSGIANWPNPDGLDIDKLLDTEGGEFAPIPTALDSSERKARV